MEEINLQKAWETIFKIHRSNYASLEKVEQMEHNFKVGDFVESTDHSYLLTTPGVKCKIEFIDDEKMYVKVVEPEAQGRWEVEIKDFKLWEEPEEFEPITEDNIREVLEYNGFTKDELSDIDIFFRDTNSNGDTKFTFTVYSQKYYFRVSLMENYIIQHKDLNKVLDFMKDFVLLKPLPKKPVFDPKQFLLDNGFKQVPNINTYYYGPNEVDNYINLELYYSSDVFSLNGSGLSNFLTKENLQKLVDAAKILEGLE